MRTQSGTVIRQQGSVSNKQANVRHALLYSNIAKIDISQRFNNLITAIIPLSSQVDKLTKANWPGNVKFRPSAPLMCTNY